MKKGDKIQWVSDGTCQFAAPKIVKDIKTSFSHGTFVFVEGSETGIPIEEVEVVVENVNRWPFDVTSPGPDQQVSVKPSSNSWWLK